MFIAGCWQNADGRIAFAVWSADADTPVRTCLLKALKRWARR